MVYRQVICGSQTVAPAADNHDVIGGLCGSKLEDNLAFDEFVHVMRSSRSAAYGAGTRKSTRSCSNQILTGRPATAPCAKAGLAAGGSHSQHCERNSWASADRSHIPEKPRSLRTIA